MYITVEISFYPLDQAFGSQILEFIADLKRAQELKIRTNSMSTQISGEFDDVFKCLQTAIKKAFSKEARSALILKMFNDQLELDWLELNHD
ncbi:MAG: thiamine-binding protein [Saprospiraceae bacterium]|nr:thiamine-binding protein [Saprospiraceae bacterium]